MQHAIVTEYSRNPGFSVRPNALEQSQGDQGRSRLPANGGGLKSQLAIFVLLAWLAVTTRAVAADSFTPPPPPPNLSELGAKIQRTMTLLATSTPQKRNRVRILFYGQSVTAGPWTKAVADNLRNAYPHADLEIENRAIGGYAAPALINTAEYDLYPFYPDLMIFHVYGGEGGELEQIVARTRQRTTAEILIRTPHFRWGKDHPRDGSPADPTTKKLTEDDERQSKLIRELAVKYGCELAEVREPLRQYLAANHLFPKDTLGDSVHPNKLGAFLIEKLVMPYLRYDPKFPPAPWKDLVRDIPVGSGPVELAFEGNRVDVIAAHTSNVTPGTAKVLIDGKSPSQLPELYYHTRPKAAPGVWWPAINRIDREKPLVLEKWTARILECDVEKNLLRFEVTGSQTGPDGQGDLTKRFVSHSGRVVIEPNMWSIIGALRYRKMTLPKGYEVTWEVKPLFTDTYAAPKTTDPAKEYATTLAQGLTNTRHTLRLVPNGDGPVPIAAVRTYRPPLSSPASSGK